MPLTYIASWGNYVNLVVKRVCLNDSKTNAGLSIRLW